MLKNPLSLLKEGHEVNGDVNSHSIKSHFISVFKCVTQLCSLPISGPILPTFEIRKNENVHGGIEVIKNVVCLKGL